MAQEVNLYDGTKRIGEKDLPVNGLLTIVVTDGEKKTSLAIRDGEISDVEVTHLKGWTAKRRP